MRYVLALFATLVLTACSTAPVTRTASQAVSPTQVVAPELPKASLGPVIQFLLTAAATDFHTHRPPDPVRFRDVRIGHVMTPSGEEQYMLCGQFLPAQEGSRAHRSYGTRRAICRPRCRADLILCDRVQEVAASGRATAPPAEFAYVRLSSIP